MTTPLRVEQKEQAPVLSTNADRTPCSTDTPMRICLAPKIDDAPCFFFDSGAEDRKALNA